MSEKEALKEKRGGGGGCFSGPKSSRNFSR